MRFNMSNPLVRSSKAALTNGADVGLLFGVTSRMRPQMILARKSPRAIRAGKGARVCVDALVAFTLVGSSEALWAVLALVCSIGDWDLLEYLDFFVQINFFERRISFEFFLLQWGIQITRPFNTKFLKVSEFANNESEITK